MTIQLNEKEAKIILASLAFASYAMKRGALKRKDATAASQADIDGLMERIAIESNLIEQFPMLLRERKEN